MEFYVRVIEARNVPAGDIDGKSDCYVSVSTERTKNDLQKTKVVKNTLSPVFQEDFMVRVDYVTDNIIFGLFDHDAVGSDDQLGLMHIRAHDLNPGIVEDRWWKMNKISGKKTNAELHLQTHLVYPGVPKFQPTYLLLIDCYVKVVEGKEIPKMDTVGKTDPYIKLTISTDQTQWASTTVKDNTLEPKWDESFLFYVTNPTVDKLMFKMWDKDVSSDDCVSTLEIPLANFKVGVPVEQYYDFSPVKGVKTGGKVKLFIQLAPKNTNWPKPQPTLLPLIGQQYKFAPVDMPYGGYPPSQVMQPQPGMI